MPDPTLISITQSAFTGGELTPAVHNRPTLDKYSIGCKTLRNFIVHPHGEASNRGGTEFVVRTKYANKPPELIPFQFSTEQSYMLELGEKYIRFMADGGQVKREEGGAANTHAFSLDKTYYKLDIVVHNDKVYYSTEYNNTNRYPDFNPDWWREYSYFSLTVTYNETDVVKDPFTGDERYCLLDGTVGRPLADGFYWRSTEYQAIKTYSVGGLAWRLGVLWTSIQDGNGGHTPSTLEDYWSTPRAYDPGTSYSNKEHVVSHATEYVSKVNSNEDNLPVTSPDKWRTLDHDIFTEIYDIGDLVTYAGNNYLSRQDDNTGHATTETAWWFRIDYSASAAYSLGDVARYTGIEYVCIQAHTGGQTPNDTSEYWSTSAYSSKKEYWVGDQVDYNDKEYYSLADNNLDNAPPSNPDVWYLIQSGILEIPTPYLQEHIPYITIEQSADTLYLTHPEYPNKKLVRHGTFAWVLSDTIIGTTMSAPTGVTGVANPDSGDVTGYDDFETFEVGVTAIGEDLKESLIAIQSSGPEVRATDSVTWSQVQGAEEYDVYRNKSGKFVYIGTAIGNEYEIPNPVIQDLDLTDPIENNPFDQLGLYPACAAFFEQRLTYAGSLTFPQSIWGSRTGDFDNFNKSSPLRDDDSYKFTLNSRQVHKIRWMVVMDVLIIGTDGAIWSLSPGSNADAVVPTKPPKLEVQTNIGVSHIQPIVIGKTVMFLESSNKVVRDLAYTLEADGYDGNDVTILAEHLFERHGITSWCYQRDPNSIIWSTRDDGVLLGFTYYKEHKIWAWHRHDTSGVSGRHSFYRVANIRTQSDVDDTYAVVQRKIKGTPLYYIERFKDRLPSDDIADAYFVDCGLSYNGAPTRTFTGLVHLEGEAVSVLADGHIIHGLVVSGGQVTLPTSASKVHIGLGYTAELETLDFEVTAQNGTLKDKKRSVVEVYLGLRDSVQAYVGPDLEDEHMYPVDFRDNESLDEPVPLYSGQKTKGMFKVTSNQAKVAIKTKDPVPLTVQSITARVEFGLS